MPNKNLDATLIIYVSETKCEAHRVWPICLLLFNFLIAMSPLIHKQNLKSEYNCVLNFYTRHNGLKKSRAANYGQIHQIEYMLLLLYMKKKSSKVWGDWYWYNKCSACWLSKQPFCRSFFIGFRYSLSISLLKYWPKLQMP